MSVLDKFTDIQRWLVDHATRVGKGRYARILRMARKPTKDEYVKTVEITGFGLILIGIIGFLIYYILSIVIKIP